MDERIKALIANKLSEYTEADLEALTAFADGDGGEARLACLEAAATETPAGDPPPETPPVETKPADPPAPVKDEEEEEEKKDKGEVKDPPVEAKAPTWEDTIAAAPAHMRRRFQEMEDAEKAEKAEIVATLSEAQDAFTDEELGVKDVPELRQLAAMIQPDAPAPIDFGARGVPNHASSRTTAPKPPSLTEAVKASRKAAAG